MSTRCCVRLHDPEPQDQTDNPILLYHHRDGGERFMMPKIKRFLEASHAHLVTHGYEYAWNAPMVAALMIMFSVEDHADPIMPYSTDRPDNSDVPFDVCRANGGLPELLPVAAVPDGVEHVYDVWLSPISGGFRIDHSGVDPHD